jgi:thiol-disulfide isomerase/thioredoxin
MFAKKIFLFLFSLFFIFKIFAVENTVNIYFFWSETCPHCAKEKIFLNNLKKEIPNIIINNYEVSKNKKNSDLLRTIGEKYNINVTGVPLTIIGKDYLTGYLNDQTTGKQIQTLVNKYLKDGDPNILKKTILNNSNIKTSNLPEKIDLPVFGSVFIKDFSLPFLTFIIALLDGFNPCAMWTLLFLISLLLGMKNKKRMWILGTTFIATSAFVYFLFLSAWLNLFLFLGFVFWIRIIVGIVALGSGIYYLRDYWINRQGSCSIMGNEKRQRVFEKLKNITQKQQFFLALGGIILLAAAVNIVELICSAGLPAIYTQILSFSNLPTWQYYLYLIFYIFIFMLDDLFVFFTAMITLQAVGIQTKYSRFSHLIGGIIILIIGLLLLFKPEFLMFN